MRTLVGIAVGCLMGCGVAWAQGTAQIHGTVRDASGAAVPGAEVRVTQTETGGSRTVGSGADGGFVLTSLPTGPYQIEVAKQGFSKTVETGILLRVNSDPLVEIALRVGAVSEQVTVEANAAQVETRSSTVGTVIENQRILDLPLNGRQVTDLITLSGGAVQTGSTRDSMGSGVNPTPILTVGGSMGYAVAYNLDGASHVNPNSGAAMPLPFPDALQEFKVDTSGASIDQGRSAGMSAVTKSGTNQLHGDAFEFLRNDLVNAHPYFSTSGGTLKRNQFGGTLGGAIRKDKLFFFGGFQGTIVRQDPADLETFIPTAAMLAGDWTAFASAACNNGTPLILKAPFGTAGAAQNTINPALFSKTGLNYTKLILAQSPRPDNACGHVRYGSPNVTNEYQGVGRVDYQLSAKHSLFARYQQVLAESPHPYTVNHVVFTTVGTGQDTPIQSLALGSTYVFGPTIVNSFRAGAHYANVHNLGADFFSLCDAGSNYYCGFAPHRTNVAVTGGPTVGGSGIDPYSVFHVTMFSINDDLSVQRGPHQMSFGFTGMLSRYNTFSGSTASGRNTINGQVTGHGLGDLLTGKLAQLAETGYQQLNITAINPTLYAADTWRATQRLTVSLSLRWDPFIPQRLSNRGLANFNLARFNAGIRTTLYPYAPSGWYFPGDPGTPGWRGSYNKLWDFAPRLGLAWDPLGDGRTSIRSSFAYTYSPVLNQWREDTHSQSPWGNGTRLSSPVGGLDDPWLGYTYIDPRTGATVSGIPFPALIGKGFTNDGEQTSTPYDIQAPQTASWNLSIQRQIGTDWLVSAAYLGSTSTHIWIQEQGNPAIFIPGNCVAGQFGLTAPGPCASTANVSQRRLFNLARPLGTGPGNEIIRMGTVALLYSGATLSYNGMLLSAQKRLSRGTTIQANYTWSHCLADAADLNADGPDAGESHTKPGDRHFDRGNCPGDRRQLVNLTGVARTPKFSGRTTRFVASNWQLAGIYRWSSGAPLNISAGSDRALNGQLSFFAGSAYQRASQVLPNEQAYTPGAGGPFSQWLNKAAFALPALGTLGTYRRNELVGPSTFTFDVALSRTFSITESQRMEIRGEAFNLLNKFRPGNPGVNFGQSGTFGQIRTALDTRILQFALKYVF